MQKKIIPAVFALLFAASFFSCAQKLPVQTLTITTAGQKQVTVLAETAETAEQRNRGFMERKNIPDGTGMIFIFERDQILNFWMKNTPSPLSIAYIDSKGTIRDIFDMTPFSLSSVTSTVSVRYALEVPQGWFAKNGIKPGDRVSIPQSR
ncbi:DUF192 domain-containing protein [uncultured Treponema sp.]|uniref:DUF192 domain-containing protein n=1 Tax=uncultured Treponema sp. TaxID=162155 RepID=UPI0015BA5236|nr:DUF192 domain-containing protein [uncultured Treponema sp.]